MQEHDKEIERIQQYLREKGILFLTPFSTEEDFTVRYVTIDSKTKQFLVVREQIGDIFNHQNVSAYLAQTFPKLKFIIDDVELAYYIMRVLIQKATHIECMTDDRTDFCHDDGGAHEGKARYLYFDARNKSIRKDVKCMFQTTIIFIPCYGLDMQRKGINWRALPQFQLIELLQNSKKLRIFFDYWRTVPDCNSVYRILHRYFPPDICNKIICMVAKDHG